MKTLNPEFLKEIAIETRQCFLTEDAPTYLANLQKGLAQIQSDKPDYIFLMHAAHSLKGGAAIAELNSLSQLAHKLEDLLEILQHNEFCDRATIAEVLSHGIDEVASILSQASNLPNNTLVDIKVELELLQKLDVLLANVAIQDKTLAKSQDTSQDKVQDWHNITIKSVNNPQDEAQNNSQNNSQLTLSPIVISALEKDLESCIQYIETELLANFTVLSDAKIREELQYFCAECLLLGDTLSLDWLVNIVEPFEIRIQQELVIKTLLSEAEILINTLRSQRLQYLYSQSSFNWRSIPKSTIHQNPSSSDSSEAISYLRIASMQVESMTNTVAEMILRHERLLGQQQQLGQTNKNLQTLVLRMIPLQEQVQTIYDQLATNVGNQSIEKDLSLDNNPINSSLDNNNFEDNNNFDRLELDRYSSSHTTLQNLQEVLLRVRESRSDIDLSYRQLGEEIGKCPRGNEKWSF